MEVYRVSSSPARNLEIWISSKASTFKPIHGAFFINLVPSLMVNQTIEFIREQSLRDNSWPSEDSILLGFFKGMRWFAQESPNQLILAYRFNDADELCNFEIGKLFDAIRQLEIHVDINLIPDSLIYKVDGRIPLMIIERIPIRRGFAFEVEEREKVINCIKSGDIELPQKAIVSQQHYSTGMALLAGEDAISGLFDGAFMQFYLAIEALLESDSKKKAISNGNDFYGDRFSADLKLIVEHVYRIRHQFFGHAQLKHPKKIKGMLDPTVSFDIAKQVLVARWCARALLSIEVGRDLVCREMRLYLDDNTSICFDGRLESLRNLFL